MAYDSFLKIEGIKGESLDSKHKDEIEVLSFSWGATQPGAFGGGGGTGKVSAQDFSFVVKIEAPLCKDLNLWQLRTTVNDESFRNNH